MWLFKCHSCEQWAKQYRALQLELADTREQASRALEAWAVERKDLLDRIAPVKIPVTRLSEKASKPVLNLPGRVFDLRPAFNKKSN